MAKERKVSYEHDVSIGADVYKRQKVQKEGGRKAGGNARFLKVSTWPDLA